THRASLVGVSDLQPTSVVPLLTGRLGHPYRFVESCPSTQRLIGEDEPDGSILMSVLLRPDVPMPLWPELSIIAGGAVAAALQAETGVAASLLHPNDVVVGGRKLVGVLPEATSG